MRVLKDGSVIYKNVAEYNKAHRTKHVRWEDLNHDRNVLEIGCSYKNGSARVLRR